MEIFKYFPGFGLFRTPKSPLAQRFVILLVDVEKAYEQS